MARFVDSAGTVIECSDEVAAKLPASFTKSVPAEPQKASAKKAAAKPTKK